MEVKTLIEEQGRLFEQFKTKIDQEIAEIKKLGAVTSETKTALDEMNARFDQIELQLKRAPFIIPPQDPTEKKSDAFSAMEKVFRFGLKGGAALDHMTAEEKAAWQDIRKKSLAATTDLGGGNLVPEDYQALVIKKLANLAGLNQLVSHQTTSRDVVRWPKVTYTSDDIDTSSLSFTWEDEADTVTTTDPTPIGSVSIPVRRGRFLVLIDRELLEDTAVDVMALLAGLAADKINVERERVFSTGYGGKRPEGFMTNTDISTVNTGSSGNFTFDGLMDLVYNLPAQYEANASFLTKRLSMGAIRKLKDGVGQYLWQPSTQAGVPATLLGYPIRACEHLAAAASAARAMIFADFMRLYMAVEKANAMSVQRLDEKYSDTDQVGFIYRTRFGGGVIAPWAGKIQVLS